MRHRLYIPVMLSCVAVTNASPTTMSFPVVISLFEQFAAANAKGLLYFDFIHPTYSRPNNAGVL